MKIQIENEKLESYVAENLNTRTNPELLSSISNQEINFDYAKSDEEIILKSKIEICKQSFQYYREFTFLDDNKDVIKRYAIFNKEREEKKGKTLLKGRLSFLSKKDIKIKNVITKSNEELLEHFNNIIDDIDRNESFKGVLKDLLSFKLKNIDNILPILYYDDELKKNVWYIPNFKGQKEDIILDYDNEIPIFGTNFKDKIYNKDYNTNYFIINRKGLEIFSTNYPNYKGEVIKIKIKDIVIDKEKFYFSSLKENNNYNGFTNNILLNKEMYIKSNNELTSNYLDLKNDDRLAFNISYPNISLLDELATENLLKKVGSKKTLDEVKNNIKIYSRSLSSTNPLLSKYNRMLEHNLFVSNDINPENFQFSKKNMLCDLCIKDKVVNLLKMQMEPDFLLNSKELVNNKKDKYYIVKNKNGIEYLLPKDNEYNKNLGVTDNFNLMFSNHNYTESTFVKIHTINEGEKGVYDLGVSSELKYDMINSDKHLILVYTKENNLFFINTRKGSFNLIENTKELDLLDYKTLNLLNLNNKNLNLDVLKTDSGLIYIPKDENFTNIKIDYLNKEDYIKVDKNKNGNYILKAVIPLKNNARSLKYDISEDLKTNFKIENGELRIKFKEEEKETKSEMFLEYEFKENFLKLLTDNIKNKDKKNLNAWSLFKKEQLQDIEKYYEEAVKTNNPRSLPDISFFDESLVGMKVNNINIDKKYSLMFLNKLQMKENELETTFNIKLDENNLIIDITDRKSKFSKYLLINNFKNDFNISFYRNNDVNSNLLFNLIKSNKIIKKIDNKEMNKEVLFSKDKMFILDKFDTSIVLDIDYEKTIKMENSILNNEKYLSFSNKKGVFNIVLDNNKKIKTLENSFQKKKLLDTINSYDNSLI